MILRKIYENKNEGFYVDIGAYHPKRFSNTHFFYRKGWRGINVDARPESMRLFNKIRTRDINLELAVSNAKEELVYYAFDEPALNGFNKELSEARTEKEHKLLFTKKIKTITLKEILDNFLPVNIQINFLSVDVEGNDLNVLKSNNWDKYQPDLILVENLNSCEQNIYETSISKYLYDKDYFFFAKTANTAFYKKRILER